MNNLLKVLIIDDEADARNALQEILAVFNQIQIIGDTENLTEALKLIVTQKPDIVFLDIEMPVKSGLEFARDIADLKLNTEIVFVTAHNKFAIEAFKVSAFDYLLKPVSEVMINDLLQRYSNDRPQNNTALKLESLFSYINNVGKIRLNTRNGFLLVNPADVLYLEAESSYTRLVYEADKEEIVCLNIGAIEETLPSKTFFRISRSHLINLDYLESVSRKTNTCTISRNSFSKTLKISGDRLKLLDLRMR
jgi:DNA-binding LytR/AlgR family response regulator